MHIYSFSGTDMCLHVWMCCWNVKQHQLVDVLAYLERFGRLHVWMHDDMQIRCKLGASQDARGWWAPLTNPGDFFTILKYTTPQHHKLWLYAASPVPFLKCKTSFWIILKHNKSILHALQYHLFLRVQVYVFYAYWCVTNSQQCTKAVSFVALVAGSTLASMALGKQRCKKFMQVGSLACTTCDAILTQRPKIL